MSTPSQWAFAAVDELRDQVVADAKDCIQNGDIGALWRMLDKVALLEAADRIEIRSRAKAAFGADLPIRDWDREIRRHTPVPVANNGTRPGGSAVSLVKYPPTDSGNAERLLAMHGEVIRHCGQLNNWLLWDGRRWKVDEDRAIEHLAKKTLRELYVQAYDAGVDEREGLSKFALKSESDRGIRAMISRAESEPGIKVALDALDGNRWLFNVANGTLHLNEAEPFGPAQQVDHCTKMAPVTYDPAATSPRWLRFLNEVFAGDVALIEFIQRACGYTLSASVKEECFFLLHGSGRNGKGVFLGTLQSLFGNEYSGTIDFRALQVSRRDSGPRDDIASMRGKRLVISQESGENAVFDEALLKWLTGGDRVRARLLFQNAIEFDPTWKLFLASNHKPRVKGTDPAIWSRIRLIPFTQTFEGREDRDLKSVLLGELSGILNWAIEGFYRWREEGLKPPPAVQMATSDYRQSEDLIARFLEDCCIVAPELTTAVNRLYGAFVEWGKDSGEHPMSKKAFGDKLRANGIERTRDKASRSFSGVGLTPRSEGENGDG